MQTHNLKQGSPEWHTHRATYLNASDAPAMLGCSPYKTRDQLLAEFAGGAKPEVTASQQYVFDAGHRYEALARAKAEEIVGEELFPVVGTSGKLSASFDGLTMDESTGFEHKTLNAELQKILSREGVTGADLPMHYQVQMEQQCMVAGCERILFVASKWSKGGECEGLYHCWYASNPQLGDTILRGWELFAEDLKAFTPAEQKVQKAGKAPDALPALLVEITGEVRNTNLDVFREHAVAVFAGISRDLKTDQDFADAEKTVKWCADVESRLDAAKEHALSQTQSIDELFRTIDSIKEEARRTRLDLEKLVKQRKESIKAEIIDAANKALGECILRINARFGSRVVLPRPVVNFAEVIKGKRTVESIQSSVNEELARLKLEANDTADRMEANLRSLVGEAHDWGFLFPDLQSVANKAPEDFANLLTARIAAHNEAENLRRQREEEAKKQAEVAQAAAAAPAGLGQDAARDTGPIPRTLEELDPLPASIAGIVRTAAAPSSVDELVNLGYISRVLGFAVTQEFLSELGHDPSTIVKSSKLYRKSNLTAICESIIRHIEGVMEEVV